MGRTFSSSFVLAEDIDVYSFDCFAHFHFIRSQDKNRRTISLFATRRNVMQFGRKHSKFRYLKISITGSSHKDGDPDENLQILFDIIISLLISFNNNC